jgi:hypothetical protein
MTLPTTSSAVGNSPRPPSRRTRDTGAVRAQPGQGTSGVQLGDRLDDHDRGDDDEDRDRVAQFTRHRRQHTDSDEQRRQRLGQALAELA